MFSTLDNRDSSKHIVHTLNNALLWSSVFVELRQCQLGSYYKAIHGGHMGIAWRSTISNNIIISVLFFFFLWLFWTHTIWPHDITTYFHGWSIYYFCFFFCVLPFFQVHFCVPIYGQWIKTRPIISFGWCGEAGSQVRGGKTNMSRLNDVKRKWLVAFARYIECVYLGCNLEEFEESNWCVHTDSKLIHDWIKSYFYYIFVFRFVKYEVVFGQ